MDRGDIQRRSEQASIIGCIRIGYYESMVNNKKKWVFGRTEYTLEMMHISYPSSVQI